MFLEMWHSECLVQIELMEPPVGVLESFVPPTGGLPPVEVSHVVRPTGQNLHPEWPGGVPLGGSGHSGGSPGVVLGRRSDGDEYGHTNIYDKPP